MIKFKLSKNAIEPTRSDNSTGNAGIDIHANLMDGAWLKHTKNGSESGSGAIALRRGERVIIPTGVYAEIDESLYLRIADRSGNAAKHGLTVRGGVVDSSYRGEIKILLVNEDFSNKAIYHGNKIAQMIPTKISNEPIEIVEELDETDRGAKGGINE